MVIANAPGDERTERGQLVLIGAITIAFILLGVVVIFNGVQYTETVNTGDAGESAEDVRITEAELEAGVEGLIEHSNETNNVSWETKIEEYVEDQYTLTRAQGKAIHVEAEASMLTDSPTINEDLEVAVTYHYTSNSLSIENTITVSATLGDALGETP
ncbi:DUF7261 family protein [Halovivax gelatinilyticus]|uniref:DUF7261 family protein n=1 Tax=Halovivax gelatinilyticus TaxID=2961597 RepID=UPI0020CA4745|nr:hypothetical protein [Halovivax gelatinilyticus]